MAKKHELSETERCMRWMALIIAPILLILLIVFAVVEFVQILVGLLPVVCSMVTNVIALTTCHKKSRRGYAPVDHFIASLDPDAPDDKPMSGKAMLVLVLDAAVAISGGACWVIWTVLVAASGSHRHSPALASFMLALLIVLWMLHVTLLVRSLKHQLRDWWHSIVGEDPSLPPKCERCGFVQGLTDRNGHRYRLIREEVDSNVADLYRDSEDSDVTQVNAHGNVTQTQSSQQQDSRASLDTSVWSVPTARPSGESEHALAKTS